MHVREDHRDTSGDGYAGQVVRDFFTHASHVPLALLILEWLQATQGYFLKPDPYVLMAAALVQSWFCGYWAATGRARPVLGNLIGPLAYSLMESALEGPAFLAQWHHLAYWVFSLLFAALQGWRAALPGLTAFFTVLENTVRAAVPLTMYALFEANSQGLAPMLDTFLDDEAHVYLSIVLLLLGVLLGFAELALRRSQARVAELMQRLKEYSSWSLGHDLLSRAIQDEAVLAMRRLDRAVLFMDIRGFTAWSEPQPPEVVVAMLNRYYGESETVLSGYRPIKIKYTADEIMAVFHQADAAVAAGRALARRMPELLAPLGLGVGIGVHHGPVVAGVVGGEASRAYDFIGDTVNTANRLCGAALAGEMLVSEAAAAAAGVTGTDWRSFPLKGKQAALRALAC